MRSFVDGVIFLFGAAFYAAAVGTAKILRNETLFREMQAVRKAWRYYWCARSYRRRGNFDLALENAKRAFAALLEAEPEKTFSQLGFVVVALLDGLSRQTGAAENVKPELEQALDVFRSMSRGVNPRPTSLQEIVEWLEKRQSQ